MIWIIGGTSETSLLLTKIKGKIQYIVSVATYSGKEVLREENVVVTRMNKEEMLEFIKNNQIDKVVDLSHPYAKEVSQNANEASRELGIDYIRYVRRGNEFDGVTYVESLEECMEYLKTISGCVMFTTGMKNIKDFEKIKGQNRFVYRILPTTYSIKECVDNNIKMQDIIAMLGPFSEELNVAVFKEYEANYVVMKNSGQEGGTPEKVSACLKLGVAPIIIDRVEEEGISDMDKLVEMIL